MVKWLKWVPLFTVIWCNSQAEGLKSVYSMAPDIYDVKGMGKWQQGKAVGQLRLIVTRMKKQDQVFLQWVQWGTQGPSKVLSTISIPEINQDGRYTVNFLRREHLNGHRKIVIGLEDVRTKEQYRAFMSVQAIGKYHCVVE